MESMVSISAPAPPHAVVEPHDGRLIERSWNEPELFAALFDKYAWAIHRYVARRLGESLAEDVTGETFLAAFQRRNRFDITRADARPWLFGIASNLIGKHRRTEVRMYRALARTGVDPLIESYADRIDDKVHAEASSRALAAALASLSQRDRNVVLLYAWADLSYDEIAIALGIPVGTVRSRLNRARRKLREALGGADPRREGEEISSDV